MMEEVKLIKRILSLSLAIIALIASSLFPDMNFCPVNTPVIRAAVTLPTPIYEYDFEEQDSDKGTIRGGGSLVDSGDPERGNVFQNMAGYNSFKRANYFQLPEDLFSSHADSMEEKKGLTVSFFVNGNGNAASFAPVFSAYAAPPENDSNTAPMFVIQGRQIMQFNANGASDFHSKDNMEGRNHLSIEHLKDNQWHNVTVTVSDEKAAYYVDGVAENIWKLDAPGFLSSEGIGTLTHICLGGNQAWTWEDSDAFYQFDDIRIFDEELDQYQIYKMMTGREPVESDKTELKAAIRSTELMQQELYTEESLADFYAVLKKAKEVLLDGEANQSEVDAAKENLLLAMKGKFTKKTVYLTDGLILDTDFTTDTSEIDRIQNCVTVNGYKIKPMGVSTIENGHIQSSKDGISRTAGISVDKRVLEDVTMDRGVTFNIKWRFSTVNSEQWADFWDLIAFVNQYDTMLMKNTIGYIFVVWGYPWLYPEIDVKNGLDWNSCMNYKPDTDMNLSLTIDSSGCRMYVDGMLACEQTNIFGMDIDSVFSNTENIVIGRDTEGIRGDLMGGLYGLQVYNRALNAAEIEALARRENQKELAQTEFTTDLRAEIIINKEGKSVFVTKPGSDGKVVADSLIKGEKYDYAIRIRGETVLTGDFIAGTDITIYALTDHSVKKDDTAWQQPDTDQQQVISNKTQQSSENPVVAKATLYTGKTKNSVMINADVSGASKEVIWRSSNTKVATVSNGKVKAVGKGTAIITATANGLSRSVRVIVKNPVIVVKKGKKKISSITAKKKKTVRLTVSVAPAGSGISLKKLSGKEKKVVKVDLKKGKLNVKGKKKGKVTLTIQSGKAVKKIRIKVK